MQLYIFDRNETLLKILSYDELNSYEYNRKLNSNRAFNFTTNNNGYLIRYNKVGFFNQDDEFQLFFIDDVNENTNADETIIHVSCIADFNSLGNSIIEDKRVVNGSARVALEKALEGTEYKIGTVEEFENKNINFYFISNLKALNEILNTYKCEFDVRIEIDNTTGRISNKFIDLKHSLGEDTGLRFTYDTNLNNIEKSVITEGHFNVLYGRGKSLETENGGYSKRLTFDNVNGGKKYIEDLDSINKYGRLEGIFENDEIDNETILLEKTREKLLETKDPKFSYNANVKDISKVDGFEHYKYKLGDTIIILDEESDTVLEARIIEDTETAENVSITLGNLQHGLFDKDVDEEIGNIKDKVDNVINTPVDDNKYPDTLPSVPILKSKGLFATVQLEWTYENKSYYTYEIYASQIRDFTPNIFDRIYEGKASAFSHESKPSQTWYYRCRAKNTHDKYTSFSTQIEASTLKILDGTEYFESAAISDAVIGELRLDRGWVGQLTGTHIDAKNLTVTDGNGKRTLNIDSFGNVNLDVNKLSIKSKSVATDETVESKLTIGLDGLTSKVKQSNSNNKTKNSTGRLGHRYWQPILHYNPNNNASVEFHNPDVINNTRNALEWLVKTGVGAKAGLLSDSMPVDANKKYTISLKTYQHRGNNAKLEILLLDRLDNSNNVVGMEKHYFNLTATKVDSFTFTTLNNTKYVRIYVYGEYTQYDATYHYAHYWMEELRLNEGEVSYPWSESTSYSETEIAQLSDEINLKVDKDGVIASINLSQEGVKINGDKVTITGYVTFDNLSSAGQTVINADNLKTGTIKALNVEGCNFLAGNFRGKNMIYIEHGGTLSCDGYTYLRNVSIPLVHPGWDSDVRGSFACEPNGYFNNAVHVKGEVWARDMGVIGRTNDAFVQVNAIGVYSHGENAGAFLGIRGYLTNHNYGVDVWYHYTNPSLTALKNVNKAIETIKALKHYQAPSLTKNNEPVIEYNLEEVPQSWVYNVEQGNGTYLKHASIKNIIPTITLAIQEQQQEIEALKQENLQLKQDIQLIKQHLNLQ